MNVVDVRPGRYDLRGDVVDVVAIDPGATPRSAHVRYVLREKGVREVPYLLCSPVVRAFQIAGQCAGSRGERPAPPQWTDHS